MGVKGSELGIEAHGMEMWNSRRGKDQQHSVDGSHGASLQILYHEFTKEEQLAALEEEKRILEERKKLKEAGVIGSTMDALGGAASLVGSGVGLVGTGIGTGVGLVGSGIGAVLWSLNLRESFQSP
ncbi:hypothetical protein Taro_040512 [Colocasia esculenta]|uniref:Uncharacterized protein n=1 Tax=Colocasia esculenta TaxID=4460 RepID=A0A843WJ88_COLES|nr:hypothetical protein [Colocasia esculenta]